MHPTAQTIIDRLEDTRQRWWVFSLLCNVAIVITVSLATLALFVLADALLEILQCAANLIGTFREQQNRVLGGEFKEERPLEYQQMVEDGTLEEHLVDPLPSVVVRTMKIFGSVALTIGLILVVLIIYAEVFGYK